MSPMSPTITDLLQSPQRVAEIPTESVLPLLCQLNTLQAALTARLLHTPPGQNGHPTTPSAEDRLLNPHEAAARLGVTIKWLYRHAKHLPFTRRLTRKALRFSESALQQWLRKARA